MSVYEHVKFWSEIKGGQEDRAALDQLIAACDLTLKRDSRAGKLSGGQKRKLQLACMFVGNSIICLMDEVTTGLVGSLSCLFLYGSILLTLTFIYPGPPLSSYDLEHHLVGTLKAVDGFHDPFPRRRRSSRRPHRNPIERPDQMPRLSDRTEKQARRRIPCDRAD